MVQKIRVAFQDNWVTNEEDFKNRSLFCSFCIVFDF